METRSHNKRKNQSPIEDDNQNKSQKIAGNQESENEEISVTIDPDLLDCVICCQRLRPPLHQCQNGHVACFECCIKFRESKCPTCSKPINFTRCGTLEKVIKSIKRSCCYSHLGCSKKVPYFEILSHQETCIHASCFCPKPNCTFSGFFKQVSSHFHAHHRKLTLNFQYGKALCISVKQDEPFTVLHNRNGPLFLLLNDRHDNGNDLSVACISMESDFTYELVVSHGESSLQLKGSPINVRKWEGVYPSKNFLLVPKNFSPSLGGFVVNVCIKKSMRYEFLG